ncbi:N,N'-diacetylchitobiose transport system substrate-binding protein [Actinacidiphila alni]|uniref:N,N'-diacetylchitobiose transport system substrate-binding protein n=1 Tax=Actinacidiphila alni TaxID=380248 RepID=A0A1I2H5B5_9ACTN|nr:extracellular solute-binding protein [Actinacidiphila alni]SFF24560.1 N,N'-diacetylchitobiose transport system substrate-binding protein [Actinacidiphila alni]
MRRQFRTTAALAALLIAGAAACDSGGGSSSQKPQDSSASGTLTVWLQVDAQDLWPKSVSAATAEFNKKFPKVKVSVQYQAWADHLTKFDASAQADKVPDVIEMGNSETAQYMEAGAFTDLTSQKATFDGSAKWQKGLSDACTSDGKLYCVPYYGGTRAVVYRKDLFEAAGITKPPATWKELQADIGTLMAKHKGDKGFSAFFMPGQHPYGSLPFVYDNGGQIAEKGSDGKWKSDLSTPAAIQGLKNWKSLIDAGMRGDRTGDDLGAVPALVAGKAAMSFSTNAQLVQTYGTAKGDPKLKGKVGSFPMPSPTKEGSFVPPYMGGSVLAVTAKSKQQTMATEWIRDFTSTAREKEFLAGGFLANTLDLTSSDPERAGYFVGLEDSWNVPAAKNWAQVEKDLTIKQMLADIATGKLSVEAATAKYGKKMEETLNAS